MHKAPRRCRAGPGVATTVAL